jgi:hypothetical protein
MGDYWRVFARDATLPTTEQILSLRGQGFSVQAAFAGDDTGWYRCELELEGGGLVVVERYLAEEEGVRAELNSWAAVLETCEDSPQHVPLMERTIQSRQLFVVRRPEDGDEALVEQFCLGLVRLLAEQTGGFYQVDGQGFFEADGTLLVAEG